MNQLITSQRECPTPQEAQEYMLEQIRRYPFHSYNTRVSATPKVTDTGLSFTVFTTRLGVAQ